MHASARMPTQAHRHTGTQTHRHRDTATQPRNHTATKKQHCALSLGVASFCCTMTAVGCEPTQLSLVELESTNVDHSGKLSLPRSPLWRMLRIPPYSQHCASCRNCPHIALPTMLKLNRVGRGLLHITRQFANMSAIICRHAPVCPSGHMGTQCPLQMTARGLELHS